jgi:hypothetical protein
MNKYGTGKVRARTGVLCGQFWVVQLLAEFDTTAAASACYVHYDSARSVLLMEGQASASSGYAARVDEASI